MGLPTNLSKADNQDCAEIYNFPKNDVKDNDLCFSP